MTTLRLSDMYAVLTDAVDLVDELHTRAADSEDTLDHRAYALGLFADLLGGHVDETMFRQYANAVLLGQPDDRIQGFFDTLEQTVAALRKVLDGVA